MARLKREQIIQGVQPYLQPGEQIMNCAYGVKQPPLLLIIGLIALFILPGIIAIALLTKEYLLVSTGRRVLVLRFKGKLDVQEATELQLDRAYPVTSSVGPIFAHLRIEGDPPFIAKSHRAGMPENREQAQAIAQALAQPALQA